MIALRRMTQDEYDAWRPASIASYAAEHVRAGNWSAGEASEQAEKAFDRYLPNGLDTEAHHVCCIVADRTGENVGHLWYCVEPAPAGRRLFIADIGIGEPYRRRGFARAALRCLEEEGRRLGARGIRLHVFGDNDAARRLYTELGYVETDVQMVKDLGT